MTLTQTPSPGSASLRTQGQSLIISLNVPASFPKGKAYVRWCFNSGEWTDELLETVGGAASGDADTHTKSPLEAASDGSTLYSHTFSWTEEVGIFTFKTYYLPDGADEPIWPEGPDAIAKIAPGITHSGNSIYTAFVRQFRSGSASANENNNREAVEALDRAGYTVIPPSGTFRNLAKRLDHIIGDMGFHIIQLLPIHPVPTTYARMGRFGSPFASLDFLSVDPALAEFDTSATPMDQFIELVDLIHAKGAKLFLDLPANHTGWASTFQIHHPEWFRREEDGAFHSPGAWGVTWADLVEIDYSSKEAQKAIADVFLFWCEKGVDGFRCDAGYMIPRATWSYISGQVRKVFPNTVFMLEGLGGKIETTDELLTKGGLDWAYSEIFQEEDRDALSAYLPGAIARSESIGPLVCFAETHDNNRLAAGGNTYASMRTALCALLSQQGAFGITAGVEWFCQHKIDVHGSPSLSWGNQENQIALISRLNAILDTHPAFSCGAEVKLITQGGGNVITALRTIKEAAQYSPEDVDTKLLVAVNLDCHNSATVEWEVGNFIPAPLTWDLITSKPVSIRSYDDKCAIDLGPGAFVCLTKHSRHIKAVEKYESGRKATRAIPTKEAYGISGCHDAKTTVPFTYPEDTRRIVMVPPEAYLKITSANPFRALLRNEEKTVVAAKASVLSSCRSAYIAEIDPPAVTKRETLTLEITSYGDEITHTKSKILALHAIEDSTILLEADGERIRSGEIVEAILANKRGSMAKVNASFGEIISQYDALLAINPDKNVPANKQIFLTRCKAWVRTNGYSFALDKTCLKCFKLESLTSAKWDFLTPIGSGKDAALEVTLTLSESENSAALTFSRLKTGDTFSDNTPIELILRPDVEARDFHGPTLAYQGAENTYPAGIIPRRNGFDFAPHGAIPTALTLSNGEFHHDQVWSYCVPHPLEAERGLHPSGDLLSPGWFSASLRAGDSTTLEAGELECFASDRRLIKKIDEPVNPLPAQISFTDWLKTNPTRLYVANRDEYKTVIAGYPWFLDWGRDTLIVLRGLIASGETDDALEILSQFGKFEENGTLPNIIHGNTVGNRDTSDAPLWFIVACGDAIDKCGLDKVSGLKCGARTLRDVIKSIILGYIGGTPNGIRLDQESGLIFSPSHFTWMDTNYPAGTPRIGYPVEIQALWIASLTIIREKFGVKLFEATEAAARKSLLTLYPQDNGKGLLDNLRAHSSHFEQAKTALRDDAIRPNQLLAITLGAIDKKSDIAKSIVETTERLLIPGGIRSLDDREVITPQPVWHHDRLLNDPSRPYWGHYTGDEDTRRKPAYHNGTAWGWQFPLWCEANAMISGAKGTEAAEKGRRDSLAILASAAALLETGVLGQTAEIMDGDAPHTARGCLAQAWSISELQRVLEQLIAQSSELTSSAE